MIYLYHGKGRNPEPVAAGMAAEKADRAGLEPLRTSQTRKPHDTRLTIPESDGTASGRRTDGKAPDNGLAEQNRQEGKRA